MSQAASESPGKEAEATLQPKGAPIFLAGSGARAGTAILFVHGFTGQPSSVAAVGSALNEAGFTVEIPRLPGHGTRLWDMLGTRYSDWRAHVRKSAVELGKKHDHVVLAGLSMGATLALDVSSDRLQKVAGVVSINAQILDRKGLAVSLAPLIAKVLPVVPAFVAGLKPNDVKKPNVDERAYRWTPVAAGDSLVKALPSVRDRLGQVNVPVLVCYSREDHSVSPENSRVLARLLHGVTEVEELVLDNSYHVATLDYDAGLLVERITAFADRVALDRRASEPMAR